MKNQIIVDQMRFHAKEIQILLNKFQANDGPDVTAHFEHCEIDQHYFYPTVSIFEYFDFQYPKRKIGNELLKRGFDRTTLTVNGKNTNGYYLKIPDNKNWSKMELIKSNFNKSK
jgi:hypothetical protein